VSDDPYLDAASGVLRNRLGISDREQLGRVEAGLSAAALADLGVRSLPGGYDLAHLQAFHREIFGDLYPWAGEIRVVAAAKSDMFCLTSGVLAKWPPGCIRARSIEACRVTALRAVRSQPFAAGSR
jgi:cell filamentation protein